MKQNLGNNKKTKKPLDPIQDCLVSSSIGELKVHHALKNYLSYCLYKTSQKLRNRVNELLREYNLVAAHLGILTIIGSSEPMSQIALGEELGFDKATMVKLIDALEVNGFVERITDTKDRRIKFINITKPGKKFTDKMNGKRELIEKDFLSILTEDEEKTLRSILLKLLSIK